MCKAQAGLTYQQYCVAVVCTVLLLLAAWPVQGVRATQGAEQDAVAPAPAGSLSGNPAGNPADSPFTHSAHSASPARSPEPAHDAAAGNAAAIQPSGFPTGLLWGQNSPAAGAPPTGAAPSASAGASVASSRSDQGGLAEGKPTEGELAPGEPVRLGMSAPFSGSGASLGREFHRGAASCLARVNASGGVHGRRVEIVAMDDGYDPERTVWNVIRLIEEERVFALFGLVGTPTVTRVLPLLGGHPERTVPLLFPFTGARPLSLPRHEGLVFRLRASYDTEFSALVDRLHGVECCRIAVLYQADAYGREGWADLRDALARRRLSLAAEASYPRGAGSDADFTEQAGLILQGMPDAVVCVGTDTACAAFIRDLRDLLAARGVKQQAGQSPGKLSGHQAGQPSRQIPHKGEPAIPVAMPSFVDSTHLVELLAVMERTAQRNYTHDLVLAEVVPPWTGNLPAAMDYRRDFAEMTDTPEVTNVPGNEMAPSSVSDGEPVGLAQHPGEVSFEGYLAARLLVRALERMGPHPSPAGLRAALAGLDGYDLGVGQPYRYTPTEQGLGLVRFTTVRNGMPVDLRDFSEWRR
ncbi:ABC transporter substrate-binding protein [Nitratidesulfovibrio liaohensis]|uniref:ABC transporter substrate-binding protein n=1 Tax=Nitratidesulfovibrio liaohensis TaxID=2604158 RepID=A0ABY9R215_9BACT|nr:ABC transporter substrate-binding protein [Nitratidesulfovibrio liaohensis]WMW65798.1 ABC transporter substrate-binding protein [Nitratidesulfovibrio liaohensis]